MPLAIRTLGFKIIRTAKIILRARAANSRVFLVSVHKKLDFTFTPPTAIVNAVRQIGADILPRAFDSIQDGVRSFCLKRILATELRVKIRRVRGHFGQGIIDLVIDGHRSVIEIFNRYPGLFPKWHLPIAIERTARIHTDRHRTDLAKFSPAARKKITQWTFHRRLRFTVPIKPQNIPTRLVQGRRRHPYLLDGPRAVNFRQRIGSLGRHHDGGGNLPSRPEFARGAFSCSVGGHAGLPLFTREILRAYRTSLRLGNTTKISQSQIEAIEWFRSIGSKREGPNRQQDNRPGEKFYVHDL